MTRHPIKTARPHHPSAARPTPRLPRSMRLIAFSGPNPRLHLFDPVAVKSALLAQFAVPAKMPEEAALRAGAN